MQDSYKYSLDDSKRFAAEAMSRLNQESLPQTPDMFELFYSYYSKNNAEVVRSIDIMVSQKFELTLERRQLLNADRSQDALVKAEEIVGSTISDVDDIVEGVKSSNSEFSGSVKKINDDFTDSVEPDQLKNLLSNMMVETNKMMAENQLLEDKLEKSSAKMQSLKNEMQEVREEAYRDSLTGLANRKKLDLEIVRVVAEARANQTPLSLVFFDIDHFKSFNDTYGHQIGDQVLKLVAKCMNESLKGRDIACRYGGEEFVIILPNTDLEGAEIIANQLRKAIYSKEIRNRQTGETMTRVTLSAGIALLTDKDDPDSFIERADQALYQAKRKGRDQAVIAD